MNGSSGPPQPPEVPDNNRALGPTRLRFEDLAQDGRLRLEGVWPPIGPILWGRMDIAASLARLGKQGVRAVLTYVVLDGTDEPLSVRNVAETEVRYLLGHTVDASGEVSRLTFDTWLEISGPRGVPNSPGSPSDGPRVVAARAYGQHVLTKPAAPAGKHRVFSLDDEALPKVPEHRTEWIDPAHLLELPSGVSPIDATPRLDDTPVVFGLCHTDGNQHVNFLAYPRVAEEAALRHFYRLDRETKLLARRAEIGYRKPCFAGQRVWLGVQAFEQDGRLGAIVAFFPEAPPQGLTEFSAAPRPCCVARLSF